VLAGAFNPPTTAHLALAEAALRRLDHVLLVLPGAFPHKGWEFASRDERLAMMQTVSSERITPAVSTDGLYIEIAAEARELFPDAVVYMICGRDAAERLIGWHADEPGFFDRFTACCRLLVASRHGAWEPDVRVAHAVEHLDAGSHWDEVSSTAVRQAIACDSDWRSYVPSALHEAVRRIYRFGR
jgi:cytidyltransferase-like protein